MTDVRYGCEWLDRGLAFSPRGIHVCCVCHHGDRGWLPISDFSGGSIPVQRIREARTDYIRAINAGGLRDCQDCGLLEKKSWSAAPYLVQVVNLSHFTCCNLNCHYCYLQLEKKCTGWWNDPQSLAAGYRPIALYDTFHAMIHDGLLAPDGVINWGGGEPTLLEEFEELLGLLVSSGRWNYVATNGVRYSPALAAGLSDGHVAMVCSVDAGSAGTFKALKGRDFFDRVMSNLKAYAATGGNVQAKYIVTRMNANPDDALEFVRLSAETGVRGIICDVDAFDPEVTPAIRETIQTIRREGRLRGLQIQLSGSGVASYPEKVLD
ncbi:MAG: radical SAM protein [Deltaproteobacteria bacterium]|nr:radical SAM protein [Deltaproteobacteria bacterium]